MLATASFDASTAVWAERGGDWECVAVVEGRALPEAAAPGEDMAKLAYKRRSFEPAKI